MLKLHAGVSKKVGLPGYSSASASCTIEAELDSSLLQDREGFQVVVRRAYQSCEQAVQDQIARLTNDGPSEAAQPQEVIEVRTSPAIQGARVTTRGGGRPRDPLSGPGQAREAAATGSRVAQQSGNACGSAIDRATLRKACRYDEVNTPLP
jgi:hypothetical protein